MNTLSKIEEMYEMSLIEVINELQVAHTKFDWWPADPIHMLAVLQEEVGELQKAVLQGTYEPHKNRPNAIKTEAIQTAAMALRFLKNIDQIDEYHLEILREHRIPDGC